MYKIKFVIILMMSVIVGCSDSGGTSGGDNAGVNNVNSVTMTPVDKVIFENDVVALNTIVSPHNATNKNYTYNVEPEGIVLVDRANDEVTGISVGKAKITVTTEDGGFQHSVYIAVSPPEGYVVVNASYWEVYTADGLTAFSSHVSSGGDDTNVKLMGDIEFTKHDDGSSNWTPIQAAIFRGYIGIFDGDNHSVSNIVVNDPTGNSVGFFSELGQATRFSGNVLVSVAKGGTVKNLKLKNIEITGGYEVGGVAGSMLESHIENVSVDENSIIIGSEDRVGGIVGLMSNDDNDIINCSNGGAITLNNSSNSAANVGGLVGFVGNSYSNSIQGSYNTGNVTSTGGTSRIGGLAGLNYGAIVASYNTGNIRNNSAGGYTGGIVGVEEKSNIFATFNIGSVSGAGTLGGIYAANISHPVDANYYVSGSDIGFYDGAYRLDNISQLNQQAIIDNMNDNISSSYPFIFEIGETIPKIISRQ